MSPFLLLFAPCLVYSTNIPSDPKHDIRRRDTVPENRDARKEPLVAMEKVTNAKEGQTQRPYRGTEDAPVDGLDGKPHAGPFVDTTPEQSKARKGDAEASATAKSVPTSLDKFKASSDDKWKLEDIPERNDGVMNDENRVAPKKGTTGTEGGISEKEKERKAKGSTENKPQEPKAAPPLPHSEQEWLEEADQEKSRDSEKTEPAKKKGGEFGKGGYGLDLPENLPDKPHTIPGPNPPQSRDGPPVDRSSPWLKETMPYTQGTKSASQLRPEEDAPPTSSDSESWHEWFHSFVLSLTMILFSEIGDKTFLVAALMAMRHSQILVFSAAFAALAIMTVLSAVLGHTLPALLPKRLTTVAAALLFLVFGAKMLREGLGMPRDSDTSEEMKEVEAELEEKEHSMALDRSRRRSSLSPYAQGLESGRQQKKPSAPEPSPPSSRSPSPGDRSGARLSGLMNLLSLVLSPAWVQTFIMTFLGEWGDRSQIATIAMAAGQDYWWVTLGAILGHACCTGLAVIGGRALAGRVSMRVGKSFPPARQWGLRM